MGAFLVFLWSICTLPSLANGYLDAEFVLYDPRIASSIHDDSLFRLKSNQLRYLSFNPCDLRSQFLFCYEGNQSRGLQFHLTSPTNAEDYLDFRYFGRTGPPLGAENDFYYEVRTGRSDEMAYSDGFHAIMQNGTLELLDSTATEGQYVSYKGGRFRVRELTIRDDCNGIESFAIEFQINQEYIVDDWPIALTPMFGWVRYNTNLTMDHDAIFAKWQEDQSRFSGATLEAGFMPDASPPVVQTKLSFPRTNAHSFECKNDTGEGVQEIFLWLNGSYTAEFKAPLPFYPLGTPYQDKIRGEFHAGNMYASLGRNRRPQPEDYNDNISEWADMEVTTTQGRGPLNTSYWCNGFQGRLMFHELNVYLCRRFSVLANVAVDFEQICLDSNDEPTNDPPVWGSIRYNSSIPSTDDLSQIFHSKDDIFSSTVRSDPNSNQQYKSSHSTDSDSNSVSTSPIQTSLLDQEEVIHPVTNYSFEGQFLSLRDESQPIRTTFDGIELLSFTTRRTMCPSSWGNQEPIPPPCQDGKIEGLSFNLYILEHPESDPSTSTTSGRSDTPKRTKYRVQLFAPPNQHFQDGLWFERVTESSYDGCTNAHSDIDPSIYDLGLTADHDPADSNYFNNDEYAPFINYGRLKFHELRVKDDCSGVDGFALDLQLHMALEISPPVFAWIRYNSNVPINQTEILERRQVFDFDRRSASLESKAPDFSFANLSHSGKETDTSSVVFGSPEQGQGPSRVSVGHIVGGCGADGIGGFSIDMKHFGYELQDTASFAAPRPGESWQPLEEGTWYVGSSGYTVPSGYGRLGFYGYDCDLRVGVFYFHELQLRDCCGDFGNIAIDFGLYCVEPVVKAPIYGWIRINSTVPVNKMFITSTSIEDRITLVLGGTNAPGPRESPVNSDSSAPSQSPSSPTASMTLSSQAPSTMQFSAIPSATKSETNEPTHTSSATAPTLPILALACYCIMTLVI